MNRKDVTIGREVYHCLLHSLGKGVIQGWRPPSLLDALFERHPRRKVVVQFEGQATERVCWLSDLRLTPNYRRIQQVAALHRARGRRVEIIGGWLRIQEEEA